MKYALSPIDEFSVINHPWQGIVLKVHIFFASFMVFALGYTTTMHALPYLKKKMQKVFKTGLSSLLMISPMIISGYLIQSFTHGSWVQASIIVHIITSIIFMITFMLHELLSHRERLLQHIIVIFILLLLSIFPLWTQPVRVFSQKNDHTIKTNNEPIRGVVERSWLLMGTILFVQIEAMNENSAKRKAEIVWRTVNQLEEKITTYQPNSQISNINRSAYFQTMFIDKTLFEIISLSKQIAQQSFFSFDITIAPLINLWNQSAKKKIPPKKKDIQSILNYIGSSHIQMNPHESSIRFKKQKIAIDMGGIGKGFALEKAMNMIKDDALFCAVFNFGGQIVYLKNESHCGERSFVVRQTDEKNNMIEFKLNSTFSLATSSNSEQYFIHKGIRYGHILDPRTGFPADQAISVTVGHPSPTLADAWATALFVLGPTHEKRISILYPQMKIRWRLQN